MEKNIEKQKAMLALIRTLLVLCGAIGSSIAGWVYVNNKAVDSLTLPIVCGAVFVIFSICLCIVYLVEVKKL